MNKNHLNNLLFLLAGTSLAIACDINVDDDDTGGGDTAGDDGAATAGDDNADTAGDDDDTAGDDNADDDTAGDDDDTAGDDNADTAGDDTAGDDTAGDDTAGDTGGEGYPECEAFASTVDGCYDEVDIPAEIMMCEYIIYGYYKEYGEACEAAAVELYACLATLDCRTLMSKTDGCVDESAAVDKACPIPKR